MGERTAVIDATRAAAPGEGGGGVGRSGRVRGEREEDDGGGQVGWATR